MREQLTVLRFGEVQGLRLAGVRLVRLDHHEAVDHVLQAGDAQAQLLELVEERNAVENLQAASVFRK
jgi:hypothetical protein